MRDYSRVRLPDLANSLRTNTLNDAQQGLANKFNAASILSGNAQTYAGNVGTYGSGAANALNNVTSAQSNSFLNQFGKGLGSGLGGGLGSLATAASAEVLVRHSAVQPSQQHHRLRWFKIMDGSR